uniref:DUF4176 domain-containing protein n=1 Tax=Strongyloides papillosus TaxID=174720 RepID=A0A0N5CIT4_STREA
MEYKIPQPILKRTGKCDENITIVGNVPDEIIKKEKTYYVGYYYSNRVTEFIKKFPEDCITHYHEKSSIYTCNLGVLDGTPKRGMDDEEYNRLLHDFLSHSKFFGG